jgi:ADP-ribose pyrophosphatase YjhB (NUDIX family)
VTLSSSATAPDWFRFCPRCGAPAGTRSVAGKSRRACAQCGYVHFIDPKVGVGVFVVTEERLLLVQRRMNPGRGQWSLPAGFVDQGEDPRAEAQRETYEETGLQVAVTDLIDVYFNPPQPDAPATIFILYQATVTGGTLRAGDDAADARYFAPHELPELAFQSTRAMVARFAAGLL